ncbi:reticulocyte-binding protein 2-like [Mercenaria mercenaria]|uniref:reticulocyte-binding protein 2-like n=1 Tax=Mercenaria mercenaria TaxID=6596 RepID=UPI00234F9C84|nr:reticulocyte-binding protein 2-like [Mercenaria mercenaria]
MKDTNMSKNLSKYQQWTDKYKTRKNKVETGRTHSVSRIVAKTRDSFRAYDSDNEMNYKRDNMGERGCGQDKYIAVEQAQERCSRPRGRLQLRLKKVKQDEANEVAETISECNTDVRTNGKLTVDESGQTDSSDLVCVYNVTDSDFDDHHDRQKLNVQVEKYQTSEHSVEFHSEQRVRPSVRSRLNSRGIDKSDSERQNKHENGDVSDHRKYGSRESEHRVRSSKWKRREKHRNMFLSESESEFEVEEEHDLRKKFRKVKSRYFGFVGRKQSAKCSTAGDETENLNESKTSDDDSELDIVYEETCGNKIGKLECEFCKKIFVSDDKLDNHYLTHFKSVKRLNTFLNKRRQQKFSVSSPLKSSSILKHSGSSHSGVKKKVVFEMDVDEGVDCRSPEINNCEIIDLMSEGDYTFESETNQTKYKLQEEVPLLNVKKEDEIDMKLKTQDGISDVVSDSAIVNETEKLNINVNGERIYCTHNTDLAKSCLQRNVEIVLKPLHFLNEKPVGKTETKLNDHETDLMNEHWSVAQNLVYGNKITKLTNIRDKNEYSKNHEKGPLKLTLSKKVETGRGNEQNKSMKRTVESENQYELDVKRGNERCNKVKMSKVGKKTEGNITKGTSTESCGSDVKNSICKFDLNRSLDRVPSKDSKIIQKKIRSRSVENGSRNSVLDIDNIKKDLIGWTKEFEKMKTLTENIANSKLLDQSVGIDKSQEIENKDSDIISTNASKKRAKKHKTTKQEKEDNLSHKNVSIVQSKEHGKKKCLSSEGKVSSEYSKKLSERSDKLCCKTGKRTGQIIEVSADVQNVQVEASGSTRSVSPMALERQTFQQKQSYGKSEGDPSKYRIVVSEAKDGKKNVHERKTKKNVSKLIDNRTSTKNAEILSCESGEQKDFRKTDDSRVAVLNSSTNLKSAQKPDIRIRNNSEKEKGMKIKSDNKQTKKGKKKRDCTEKGFEENHVSDQNKQNITVGLKFLKTGLVKKKSKRTVKREKEVLRSVAERKGKKRVMSEEFLSSSSDSEDTPIVKTDFTTRSEEMKIRIPVKNVNKFKAKTDEVDKCIENLEVKNRFLVSKDEKTVLQSGEDTSCCKKSKNKEANMDCKRKYEVQRKLEKLQSYIISKEDYFAKKDMENVPSKMDLNKNKISEVLKIGTEISSDSFDQNEALLMEPLNNDDTKIYDSCYDEILIEFAEDVDIVLKSPDKAALMFDENALYGNLENSSRKNSLNSDDILNSKDNCTVDNVEQIPVENKDMKCRNESQSVCKNESDMNKRTIEDFDNTKKSLLSVSSGLQMTVGIEAVPTVCMTHTCSSPKVDKMRKGSVENELLFEVSSEKVKETESSQREKDKGENHSRHKDKFETEVATDNSKNVKDNNMTGLVKKSEPVMHPDRNFEKESQLILKEKVEKETHATVSQVDTVRERSNFEDKAKPVINVSNKNNKKGAEARSKENDSKEKKEMKKMLDNEKQSNLIDKLEREEADALTQNNLKVENKTLSVHNKEVINGLHLCNINEMDADIETKQLAQLESNLKLGKRSELIKVDAESPHVDGEVSNSKHKKRKNKHSHSEHSGQKHKHRKTEPSENESSISLTEVVGITKCAENMETHNSYGCKHKDVSGMVNYNLTQEKSRTNDGTLNRFYRCEKCNKLFHGVANLNLKSCAKCEEKHTENSSECKYNDHLEEDKLNDSRGSLNQKGEPQQKIENQNFTQTCTEVESDIPDSDIDKPDPTDASQDVHIQIEGSTNCQIDQSDKQKKLKLLIQKVNLSSFRSDDYKCKFTGSPEQPRWKVKTFETNQTPLKLTLTNSGERSEKKECIDAQNKLKIHSSEQLHPENKSSQKVAEPADKCPQFSARKETENFKSVTGRKAENVNIRDEKIQKAEKGVKREITPKVESGVNKIDHSKKNNQSAEILNEFEKALWKEHEMKGKEKCKKKDTVKSKTKREEWQSSEKSFAADKSFLFKERRCNRSFTNDDPVQHFQKSRTAQMIYNKHQRKNVDDGLPDFSTARVDLGSLPPLSVSAKNLSDANSINKGTDTFYFQKELNLSESSSDTAVSVFSATAVPNGVNTDLKIAGSRSFTEAKDFSKDSVTDGSRFDKEMISSSDKATGVGAAGTTGFTINPRSDQIEIGFITAKTNGVSSKTDISYNVNKENNVKHLKDLKKELEAVVINKDNVKLKDLMKSFAPGSAFSPPWCKEKSEEVHNSSAPVLPSFSETFSKKNPLPINQNQTFSGFTNCDKVPGFRVFNESVRRESSYPDDESAFTELSEHRIDIKKNSDKRVSVFDRLGKRRLSEGSNSTVFSVQSPISSPIKMNKVSPLSSPKIAEFLVTKHPVEKRKDFTSTPAAKFSSLNARSEIQGSVLDISHISKCSSGVSEEASDISRPKRRKIKRYEIPESASRVAGEHEKKENLQDSRMSSMVILSAECSQMDYTNLLGSTVDKSLGDSGKEVSELKNFKDATMHSENDFQVGSDSNKTSKKMNRSVSSSAVILSESLPVKEGLNTENKLDYGYGGPVYALPSQDSYSKTLTEGDNEEDSRKDSVAYMNEDWVGHIKKSEGITRQLDKCLENAQVQDVSCREYKVEVHEEVDEDVFDNQKLENNVTRDDNSIESKANMALNENVPYSVNDISLKMKENTNDSEDVSAFVRNREVDESETEVHYNIENIGETHWGSEEESEVHTDSENDERKGNTDTEAEDNNLEEDRDSTDEVKRHIGEEEVIEDVLELYASDEEASFLLDSAEPSPPTPPLIQNKAMMVNDTEENNEVQDMELETNTSLYESPVEETFVPVNVDQLPKPPCEVPVFQPMRSNPYKTRWMPSGWCFKYFSRKTCSAQCTFRHDNPTEDDLHRYMPEIVEKCKKGELNSGMNMLESQSYFMMNICQDDLDCLYGYSVNHLNMEYCHKLLQLIANRNFVKEGHIDDIIYLWKRLVYCEDIAPLKDAFYIAKENNIYPKHRAVLILLEAFSAYSDVYMLWDVIIYYTQTEDFVVPQQFINKAVTLLITCQDTSLLSSAVSWLEKTSPQQLVNISNEPLSTLENKLQQSSMGTIVSTLWQCLRNKRWIARGIRQKNMTSSDHPNQNSDSAVSDTGQHGTNQLSNACLQSRPVTPTNSDLPNFGSRSSEQEKANQFATCMQSRAVTPVKHDSADLTKLKVPQQLTAQLKSRNISPTKQDVSNFASGNGHKRRQPLLGKKPSRAGTPTNFSDSRDIREHPVRERNILKEIKTASETSNWQELADLFVWCCKTCAVTPEVFEQTLLALTENDSNIGTVWRAFIQRIKQKQKEDPDLRLDSYSLSVLGSEIFYFCRRMNLFDARDILLVILDTEFLSLSQFVSHRWKVNLELEAAEFLCKIKMPTRSAQIVLEFSSTSLECHEVRTRLWNILIPLTEQLCMEGNYTVAFQIFYMAFMWKYRGLRRIASDLIESCLNAKMIDIPIQIYELYITDNRKFDIRDTLKRSLLNALVETKNEYGKRLFLDMKQNISAHLFPEQSYKKPRCIWIHSLNTRSEIKLMVEQYLNDLYDQFCDQVAKNATLTSEELFLDLAINKLPTLGNPVVLPYVGPAMASPSIIKRILLSEFGIQSELSCQGGVKITVYPASLEKYIKHLDLQGHNLGLEFSKNMPAQQVKRHKIKR